MDFLFVAMIEHFKNLGLDGMNLGFAPLANISGGGVAGATLRLLYARGSAAFNFRGLRTFKQKWKPDWQPRYLVYRSDFQLPAIALAVARAGERSGSLRSILPRPSARPAVAAESAAE
jgi:phosphatidylglycerol lysyltransferase